MPISDFPLRIRSSDDLVIFRAISPIDSPGTYKFKLSALAMEGVFYSPYYVDFPQYIYVIVTDPTADAGTIINNNSGQELSFT